MGLRPYRANTHNAVALALTLLMASLAVAQTPGEDIPALARNASPAVVRIVLCDQAGNELGSGSGFLIASEGKLVTNYHVIHISGTAQAEAKFTDGASYQIEGALGTDPDKDLAILKVHAVGREFPFLHLGDSDTVQFGEHVVAIGSPLAGLSPVSTEATVSDGIVSGIREWPEHQMKVFQITAPISPGSSGGALVNSRGEVIGVTFAQLVGGQNLNFAIPIAYVQSLATKGPITSLSSINPASLPTDPFSHSRRSQQASPKITASPQEMLLSAKTLCVWVSSGSPVLKSEISDKLLQWGKLTLVSSPDQADLILEITQTGQLNVGTGAGNQATAMLRDRVSGTELWSKTKGGGWAMSGWSNAWVGRALASELTKFFDHVLKASPKKSGEGSG